MDLLTKVIEGRAVRNLLLKQSLRYVILFTPTNQPHAICHNGRQWTFSPAAQDEYSRAESRRFVQEMETGARDIYDCHGENKKSERNAGGDHSELCWTRLH